MTTTNTAVPASFVQGDTVTWTKSYSDYPASGGWALTYAFVLDGDQQTADGVADGDEFDVTIAATASANFEVGTYHYQGYVTKSGERHTVDEGYVDVQPNFATAAAGYDDRSHIEKVVAALRAAIEGNASQAQSSMSVSTGAGSVSIGRMNLEEQVKALRKYEGFLEREKRAATGVNRGTLKARFR